MGCAKGVPGYGMIHPNLINAAVLQCYGLTAASGYFDAMSLAPNFDLLLTQQKATNVACLIAEWNREEPDLGERAGMIVQSPLNPTVENMKSYCHCIDPLRRSPTQEIKLSEVEEIMSMGDESLWLIPIMAPILQEQGTNLRAMCHHILKCRESVALKPKLDGVTVQKTVTTVINEHLLHLLPEADLDQVWNGSQKLKAERDLFLWNYAGVLVQKGNWRSFHSYEETWTVLASFWGMEAPDVIPTCTTWPTFQDMGRPIGQGFYRRYQRYLESQRKSALTTPGDPDAGATKKPQVNLEVLLSMVDPTWKPDLHRGLDYLWTIMNESERESFLKGITTVSTSTSMSTVVPMPPKSGQSVPRPSPPQPPQIQQAQQPESSITGDQSQEGGAIPATSSQTVGVVVPESRSAPDTQAVESQRDIELESTEAQQGTATANEESDRGSTMETTTVHSSQLATAGSTTGGAEQSATLTGPPDLRNHLRNYTIGSLHLDSYVDIFNILSATASKYADSAGTYVRKLGLDNYPYQLRTALGGHDPVIVYVDSEIEQAILTMSEDLSRVREYYPLRDGIDWVKFQYHLALMQYTAPKGWTAPGFRMGGRFPLAVQGMCQRLMTVGAFANYHTTPIREWHKVRHMLTLRRDDDTRSNYARDAIQALCQYTEYAAANDNEIQQLLLDVTTVEYSSWATELDSIAAVINSRTSTVELPASQVEQLERQSRVAEESLMNQIQTADAADARRREKNREKKEKRGSIE